MAKVNHFNPSIFAQQGSEVRVYKAVQTSGTFSITAPMAYHYGVNVGYIKAEAMKYINTTLLDIVLPKNLVPNQQQFQNSSLMPFENI